MGVLSGVEWPRTRPTPPPTPRLWAEMLFVSSFWLFLLSFGLMEHGGGRESVTKGLGEDDAGWRAAHIVLGQSCLLGAHILVIFPDAILSTFLSHPRTPVCDFSAVLSYQFHTSFLPFPYSGTSGTWTISSESKPLSQLISALHLLLCC